MLAANVEFVDIDPGQWHNLGEIRRYFDPDLRTIHLVYRENQILNARDSGGRIRLRPGESFATVAELTEQIFSQYPEVQRVQAYRLDDLMQYARDVALDGDALDSDAYFRRAATIKANLPRIQTFYRATAPSPLPVWEFMDFLEKNHLKQYYFCFGIYQQTQLFFSLILGITDFKIRLISTFEHLQTLQMDIPAFTDHAGFAGEFTAKTGTTAEIVFLTWDALRRIAASRDRATAFREERSGKEILINQGSLGLLERFIGEGV